MPGTAGVSRARCPFCVDTEFWDAGFTEEGPKEGRVGGGKRREPGLQQKVQAGGDLEPKILTFRGREVVRRHGPRGDVEAGVDAMTRDTE